MNISFFKKSLLRILGLVKKEFLTILMDRNSKIILFAPVIVQCIIFGYGASFHLEHVPYVICSQSNDALSHEIEQTLAKTPHFELQEQCTSIECLRDNVNYQKSLIAIYIDSNFKNTRNLNMILDARNTASANTASGYVNDIIENINNKYFGKNPITINTQFLFNENNYTRYTILIGMTLALSIIQVLLLSSLSVTREKEDGTYDMMIMTPARPLEMLIGKALPPIIIATIQSLILITICYFYFKIPMRGSLIGLTILVVTFSVTVVGIGLTISTLSSTTIQSLIFGFSLCTILIMTSGLITAVDGMPSSFKVMAYLNPAYYGINSMWQIYLEGKTLLDVMPLIAPLIAIGIITLSIASYLFRHKLN